MPKYRSLWPGVAVLTTYAATGAVIGAAIGLAALTFDMSLPRAVGLFMVSGSCFSIGALCVERRP